MSAKVAAIAVLVPFLAAFAVTDAWADDFLIGGGINLSHDGGSAQVQASTERVLTGSQAQPQSGYDAAAPDSGSSGTNPWAKYTLVTNASGSQQLCLTVNAGQAGGPSRVQVCYDVAMPLPAPDGTPAAADPGVLAAQAVARLSVPARLRVTIGA